MKIEGWECVWMGRILSYCAWGPGFRLHHHIKLGVYSAWIITALRWLEKWKWVRLSSNNQACERWILSVHSENCWARLKRGWFCTDCNYKAYSKKVFMCLDIFLYWSFNENLCLSLFNRQIQIPILAWECLASVCTQQKEIFVKYFLDTDRWVVSM